MLDKNKLFQEAIEELDLSPTMEKNARDKYAVIANYLEEQGVESDFFPQGSFLLGTVVRPYREGKEQNYDLDILCILKKNKLDTQPREVKDTVGDCIKHSKVYSDKLKKEDKYCWTIQYADINNEVGFSLDLVPAVDEDYMLKQDLKNLGIPDNEIKDLVAITEKSCRNYEWLTSNPLGIGEWFTKISNQFLTFDMKENQKRRIYENYSDIFAKAEEIPNYLYRSNLQRAIQILKRSRDIFYERANKQQYKPTSFVLTILIADCIKAESALTIEEILSKFISGFRDKSIECIKNNKIINPVDPNEDLAQLWSTYNWTYMDKWLNDVESSLLSINDERSLKLNLRNSVNSKIFIDIDPIMKTVVPTKPWISN